jgi:hypothetical protein
MSGATGAGAAPSPAGPTPGAVKPPLDDVMLAMDVVDTLRRRERLAQAELDEAGREQDLKTRLRKIYADQGIEVTDRVIEQAVAALKEERFAYKAPPDTFAARLARLYVRRGAWVKRLGLVGGAGLAAGALYYFLAVAPNAALPGKLDEAREQVAAIAKSPDARSAGERLYETGEAALRAKDSSAARDSLAKLEELRRTLDQEYEIRIVNRSGVLTGVWRVPDANTGARNYYIAVEAVDPSGKVLDLPIKNEETGKTDKVAVWGMRVDERTFRAVSADKKNDGIIQHDRFGYKRRGYLSPDYEMQTTGGAITKW